MVTQHDIKTWIEANLNGASADVVGDGHHFEATVISEQFAGKNSLARHRLVYAALGDKMQQAIHALSLKTYTPDEIGD